MRHIYNSHRNLYNNTRYFPRESRNKNQLSNHILIVGERIFKSIILSEITSYKQSYNLAYLSCFQFSINRQTQQNSIDRYYCMEAYLSQWSSLLGVHAVSYPLVSHVQCDIRVSSISGNIICPLRYLNHLCISDVVRRHP